MPEIYYKIIQFNEYYENFYLLLFLHLFIMGKYKLIRIKNTLWDHFYNNRIMIKKLVMLQKNNFLKPSLKYIKTSEFVL